jgi:hypothetical protein
MLESLALCVGLSWAGAEERAGALQLGPYGAKRLDAHVEQDVAIGWRFAQARSTIANSSPMSTTSCAEFFASSAGTYTRLRTRCRRLVLGIGWQLAHFMAVPGPDFLRRDTQCERERLWPPQLRWRWHPGGRTDDFSPCRGEETGALHSGPTLQPWSANSGWRAGRSAVASSLSGSRTVWHLRWSNSV